MQGTLFVSLGNNFNNSNGLARYGSAKERFYALKQKIEAKKAEKKGGKNLLENVWLKAFIKYSEGFRWIRTRWGAEVPCS